MASPLIGITTMNALRHDGLAAVSLLRRYVIALTEAGATPVLIPSAMPDDGVDALLTRLDGVLFSGGGDIAPEYFGGAPHPRIGGVDPERDALELALLRRVVEDGVPFLGICRGCQLVNVGFGGTLYTHIADQHPGALKHDYYPDSPRDLLVHEVRLKEGSRLAEIVGVEVFRVNSLHHQGIERLGDGLEAVAYAPDGLVEAVEVPGHPFGMAVQWHPEWLTAHATARALFRAFVEAARGSD
ncbi:MAG: gamma-glutamyl-gamma-aminobutyrate hydrolase family protein [Anaerolineae bacterium]|nr:MAG: gamma-glutamyl-gamma-aminobutyrate hydrolase family protein [Anaerolineae bacterium]